MYDTYVKTESCREVCRQFEVKYPGAPIPGRETVRRLVNKLRTTGSLNATVPKRKRRVLTEEKLGAIGALFERSPNKSLRCVSEEVSVSKTSVFTAAKLLKLELYRVSIVHDLRPGDDEKLIQFCNWILR